LFLVAFLLCNPGDEAVTTSPAFPLVRNALEAVGADLRNLPLSFDRAYGLDVTDLKQQLSERTRLVSLASPQNPSGVAIPPKTFGDVLTAMRERCPDAYLLVDETFREAAYGHDPVAATAVTLSPRIISIASLSKCHGTPGLRLGWVITRDPSLREQLAVAKFNTVISCSAIDESLAVKVFQQRDRLADERRQHLAEGLARTADWVSRNAHYVDWVRPTAGALCCVRLKASVFDDAAVSRFYALLATQDLRVANGAWFGEQARVFRLGFGLLSMLDLDAALRALTPALESAACLAQHTTDPAIESTS
jgi:aspartate/methionine/tyrosine aminotransferase